MNKEQGFREIEHTADWAIQVWALDLPSLLVEAARGMYSLSHTQIDPNLQVARRFEICYSDPEALLVDFLSELLFLGEDENLAFDAYQIELTGTTYQFRVTGAPILEQEKQIKAVTFHEMHVQKTENGLSVDVVFDV